MPFANTKIIKTPRGDYRAQSDDLLVELNKAAEFAGLKNYNVKVNGNLVTDPSGLHTNSIAALADQASVERVDFSIGISQYDKAGK